MSSKRFSEEFQRSLLVPPLGDEAFEHLAFMIDGTPEVVLHPVDLHEHLVEMPASMLKMPHRLDPVSTDFSREDRPEPVPPEPHCLVGNVDPALVQQILDVPERERIADRHHDREADDYRARLEVAEDARVAHARKANGSSSRHKPIFL